MAIGAGPPDSPESGPPTYTKYRTRPRWLPGRRGDGPGALEALRRDGPRGRDGSSKPRKPLTLGRALRWLAAAVAAWIALSLALFLISAQIQQGKTSDEADRALSGGFPLTSPTTTLVLGSDARTAGTREPGAQAIGAPSRSDTILLIRSGGGTSSRLSIPRDTIVDIPGHGRDKINAAYALGGAALAIETIEQFLGVDVDHLVEVDFANFPKLIDAMGGIDYTGGCVVSRINGGFRNGGYTLRLPSGTTHIDGRQALALARTRKNDCNRREDDRTRARRQQKIFSAMKSQLLSPGSFVRLPWVSWQAPRAIKSDMSGPSLLGLFASLATGGSPSTRVLVGAPQGNGLVVSDAEKRREVQRFLDG